MALDAEVVGGEPADGGLFAWLVSMAEADSDRELVVGTRHGATEMVTASQMVHRSSALARGLRQAGIDEGDVVTIWLPNQIEWLESQFACSALGVAVLGLNTRYRSHEITHLVATVSPSAIILPSHFLGIDFLGILSDAVRQRRREDPSFRSPALIFIDEVPDGAHEVSTRLFRYDDLMSEGSGPEPHDYGDALSNLFTTSGSTSAPKVAGHDQGSILRHARSGAQALGVRRGDRILAALPMCGVFGFNSVMAVLVGGGSAVMMDAFDAAVAARHLEVSGITHVVGGDEMLGAMFAAVPEGANLASLRRGGIANFAGRAKDVVEQAHQRWGSSIAGVYGSSEIFALTAIWPEEADNALRGLQGGVLVDDGIEVRVADLETNVPVADGESGELQFRGYNVIDGYVNNHAASRAAFTDDHWFRTGDLGYLAHGGFVYQCRAREAMRLRGFLVEPAEIEEFFALDPSIDEVHVVGIDTDAGTKAIAFVRPSAGHQIDEPALLGAAREHLAGFKVPARVIEVQEFPTTTGTNGTKVRFEDLRELGRALLAQP